MSATKHIPGPWFAVREKSGDYAIKAPDDPDSPWSVAETISCCGYPEDHSEANAHLIAAAPELLSAIIDLADAARSACNAAQHSALVQALFDADYAIAKAEGR